MLGIFTDASAVVFKLRPQESVQFNTPELNDWFIARPLENLMTC